MESIAEYVAELRKAASFCEFVDFLDDALQDRFVCGLPKRAHAEASSHGGVSHLPELLTLIEVLRLPTGVPNTCTVATMTR